VVDTYLKLPEKRKEDQIRSKRRWNILHGTKEPDFFTIGYSGRNIDEFTDSLILAGVITLIDVRFSPVCRFKPEFSKNNLKKHLENHNISYVHRPEWGVPRDIRAFSIGKPNRDDIWRWYDTHILPNVVQNNISTFFYSMEQPVVFMCSELDPTECHRHRIFLGLEQLGFTGYDL
jgi:uncharacterized protein (DUF488 family)